MNWRGPQRSRLRQRTPLILLALFLATLVRMPASVLAEILESGCAQRCLLAVPQGDWWQGSGRLFLRAVPDAAWHDLGEIHWRPEQILSGLWRIDLAGGSIRISPRPTGLAVRAQDLLLPEVMRFPLIWPGLPGSGWSGRIGIRHGQWNYALGGGWSGEVEIEGRDLSLDLLSDRNLPPIAVKWAVDAEKGGRLSFASLDPGPIRLAGEATLTREGRARSIDTRIEIRPDAGPQLRHLVSAIAVADTVHPGHYRIAHNFE